MPAYFLLISLLNYILINVELPPSVKKTVRKWRKVRRRYLDDRTKLSILLQLINSIYNRGYSKRSIPIRFSNRLLTIYKANSSITALSGSFISILSNTFISTKLLLLVQREPTSYLSRIFKSQQTIYY